MTRPRPTVLAFAVAAGLTFLLGAIWTVATPLFASPDEPSHAIRAVATWAGDADGRIVREDGIRVKMYRVPAPYGRAQAIAVCSAFQVDQTADCGPAFDVQGRSSDAMSTAGFYPPLFYRLVGWGGALVDGSAGMYLMRLIHSAAVAVLVGFAAVSTVRRGGGALALAGIAVAVTPMVVFLAGTVNSSGLEIAASIALWCSLLALLAPTAPPLRARWLDAGIAIGSGSVLIFTRTFSPGYAAVIAGIALVATAGLGPRELLRRRDVIITYAVLAVAAVAATGLIVASGQFDSPATSGRPLAPGETPLSVGLGMTERIGREMVAVFGWLDTGTAQLSYYVWIVACCSLVMGAVLLGQRRALSGLALAALATFVLPIAANWGQARTGGFVWQGRYSLPLAVGVPILAALICDQAGLARRVYRRFVTTLGVLVAVGQTYAAYWALRRFAVGLHGELFFFGEAKWAPPGLGTTATMVAVAAVSAAVAATLVLAASALPRVAAEDDPPMTPMPDGLVDARPSGAGPTGETRHPPRETAPT